MASAGRFEEELLELNNNLEERAHAVVDRLSQVIEMNADDNSESASDRGEGDEMESLSSYSELEMGEETANKKRVRESKLLLALIGPKKERKIS